jgi:hypothetical protein
VLVHAFLPVLCSFKDAVLRGRAYDLDQDGASYFQKPDAPIALAPHEFSAAAKSERHIEGCSGLSITMWLPDHLVLTQINDNVRHIGHS